VNVSGDREQEARQQRRDRRDVGRGVLQGNSRPSVCKNQAIRTKPWACPGRSLGEQPDRALLAALSRGFPRHLKKVSRPVTLPHARLFTACRRRACHPRAGDSGLGALPFGAPQPPSAQTPRTGSWAFSVIKWEPKGDQQAFLSSRALAGNEARRAMEQRRPAPQLAAIGLGRAQSVADVRG
jgi:hypothetical protein